jgi:hypothetical protein
MDDWQAIQVLVEQAQDCQQQAAQGLDGATERLELRSGPPRRTAAPPAARVDSAHGARYQIWRRIFCRRC